MKTNQNSIISFFLTAILILGIDMYGYAAFDTVWKNIYSQTFSGNSLPLDMVITESKSSFSADIENGALLLKTDSLSYFQVKDFSDVNGSINSHGISLSYAHGKYIEAIGHSVEIDGVEYRYWGKNNGVYVEKVDGINALKQFTYINRDMVKNDPSTANATTLSTNQSKFNVNRDLFGSADNKIVIEVKYYTPDNANNMCILTYPSTSGTAMQKVIYDSKTSNFGGEGKWNTAKIELTDADFTKQLTEGEETYSFKVASSAGKENYIHSIWIYKTEKKQMEMSSVGNVIEKQIDNKVMRSNVKMSYDMTIPSKVACAENVEYNTGDNSMAVNLLDVNKIAVASIQYDIMDNLANIYALYSDASGNEKQKLLYSGKILDKLFTYTITYMLEDYAYSIEISEGGVIKGKTDEPILFNNRNSINGTCAIQYMNVVHNPQSKALLSILDNIDISIQEDTDYKKCLEDAESIMLEISSDGGIRKDFALPTSGNLYGSDIIWSCAPVSIIEIKDGYAIVSRPPQNTAVTLTAKVMRGEVDFEKSFSYTVIALGNTFTISNPYQETVDGIVYAKLKLTNPGLTGAEKITFAIISVDSDGNIRDRMKDVQTVDPGNYEQFFSIPNIDQLHKQNGDRVEWYLWDENNCSLVNNSPELSDIIVSNRAKAVALSWTVYDDYNAVAYYDVYRNGEWLARCTETEYKDMDASYLEQEYSVIPVDDNGNVGEKVNNKGNKIQMPYYLTTAGKTESSINSTGKGINMLFREETPTSSPGAATRYAEVIEGNGSITPCRYVPDNKYIAFTTDRVKNHIGIDITYRADEPCVLVFLYNKEKPEGVAESSAYAEYNGKKETVTAADVGKWRTFSVKIDDADFRITNFFSAANFGLKTQFGNGIYVKKVEFIESDLYD